MTKSRILIVEDESVIAEDIGQSLRAQGYEVSISGRGEEAWEQASAVLPDLVLLDIVLPGDMDGIRLGEELVRRDVPHIYITGHLDERLFERARITKPQAYLSKPLRMNELHRTVELAFDNRDREIEEKRDAERLRISEQRFRSLAEGFTEHAIFTLDVNGRVDSWNQGTLRTLGYTEDEILGKPFGLVFTPEDRANRVPEQELERARNSGSADDSRWLMRRDSSRYWVEGTLTALRGVEGEVTGFIKVTRDMTEQRRLQEALREREERLRIALKAARSGTWCWNLRTNLDTIDDNLRKLFGLLRDQPFETVEDFFAIVHPEDRAQVIEAFNRTLSEGTHLDIEFRVVWPDKSEHWLLDQGEVALNEEGQPAFLTGVCVDVTQRKQAAEALRESERRFRIFADNVRDYALLQMDPHGHIVAWNTGAEKVLGYSESEILGQSISVLFTPEDIEQCAPQTEMSRAREAGRAVDERWHVRKDGSWFWASGILTSISDERGRLAGFSKVMRDETERRRVDEQVRASLREKEVLPQEIHHRVKNNLQVISSLLRLQSEHISDKGTLALFEEARNRVQAIGGIHELLYQSPDLARVDFGQYLKRLTKDLFRFYGISDERLRFELQVNDANLNITQAVPCGLLVNELVTNSLKHAFPAGRRGRVRISLNAHGRQCFLIVEDDGAGLPGGFDWQKSDSLGLQLVHLLSMQLDGSARMERLNPGTRFEITFPLDGQTASTGEQT